MWSRRCQKLGVCFGLSYNRQGLSRDLIFYPAASRKTPPPPSVSSSQSYLVSKFVPFIQSKPDQSVYSVLIRFVQDNDVCDGTLY